MFLKNKVEDLFCWFANAQMKTNDKFHQLVVALMK